LEKMFQDYLAAWNSRDIGRIASFFTDDCIYEDVALSVVNHSREELKAFAGATFATFPDVNFEVTSFFVAGGVGRQRVDNERNAHGRCPRLASYRQALLNTGRFDNRSGAGQD
jgi:hypothetical protein